MFKGIVNTQADSPSSSISQILSNIPSTFLPHIYRNYTRTKNSHLRKDSTALQTLESTGYTMCRGGFSLKVPCPGSTGTLGCKEIGCFCPKAETIRSGKSTRFPAVVKLLDKSFWTIPSLQDCNAINLAQPMREAFVGTTDSHALARYNQLSSSLVEAMLILFRKIGKATCLSSATTSPILFSRPSHRWCIFPESRFNTSGED